MAEANREDAAKCISIARQALLTKDFAKAEKFAAKAQRLYPSDEVCPCLLLDSLSSVSTVQLCVTCEGAMRALKRLLAHALASQAALLAFFHRWTD